jgi:hypothetical protein
MRLEKLTNTNLHTIVQVYQYDYANRKSPGLGDFLRGSFYLMQLSRILNVNFKMDISNHPISEFIINDGKRLGINYKNIQFVEGMNRPEISYLINPPNNTYFDVNFANKIIRELNKSRSQSVGLFTNAFPIYYNFLDYGRNFIKSQLMPNKTMTDYIDKAFNNLRLKPNTYAVIHIRTGDEYLSSDRKKSSPCTNQILNRINNINNPAKKYLILSDNNALKLMLKDIPNFYVYMHNIEHLGGEVNYNKSSDGIKNTLLEFYLMSYSNSILSLSIYDHISGFSRYCSEVYNIPFRNIQIKKNPIKMDLNMKNL